MHVVTDGLSMAPPAVYVFHVVGGITSQLLHSLIGPFSSSLKLVCNALPLLVASHVLIQLVNVSARAPPSSSVMIVHEGEADETSSEDDDDSTAPESTGTCAPLAMFL